MHGGLPFGVKSAEKRTRAAALVFVLLCAVPTVFSQSTLPAKAPSGNQPNAAVPVNFVVGTQADIAKLLADWNLAPESASFTPVSDHELARVKACLEPEVARYPHSVLRDVLNRVVVLGTLRNRHNLTNGTYSVSGRDVFVATMDEQSMMDSCSRIRSIFHHEVSSIILRKHADRFPKDKWLRLNPPGFVYRHANSLQRREGGDDPRLSVHQLTQGFVSEYSTVAFEEDFNTLAELLMSETTDATALAMHYPRLREKLRLADRFYRELGINTPDLKLPSFDPADCPLDDGPPPQSDVEGLVSCELQFVRNVGQCSQYFPDPESKEFADCVARARVIRDRCDAADPK